MVSPETGNLEMSTSDNCVFRKTVYTVKKENKQKNKNTFYGQK